MFNSKLSKVGFTMAAGLIFVVTSTTILVYAQGKGRGQKGTPPGWEELSKKEQNSWKENLDEVKDSIKGKGKKVGFSQEEIEQTSNSLEIASRVGVPIEDAKDIVQSAMDKGLRGSAIDKLTRAVSYGVGREVKFDQLGNFVNEKLDAGLKDDELALEVYKEVQRRHEEKTKADLTPFIVPLSERPSERGVSPSPSEGERCKYHKRSPPSAASPKGTSGRCIKFIEFFRQRRIRLNSYNLVAEKNEKRTL